MYVHVEVVHRQVKSPAVSTIGQPTLLIHLHINLSCFLLLFSVTADSSRSRR